MKKLRDLLPENYIVVTGELDTQINGLEFDSRLVCNGNLFFALQGSNIDGSAFIFEAVERGAAAIVTETERKNIEVPVVKVSNAREALSEIAKIFYNNPSEDLWLAGITGTKGKTTISYMLQSIYKQAYKRAFRIGTIEYDMETEILKAVNTTPESLVLQRLLRNALNNEIKHGVMEVSSHALKSYRVKDINFSVAAFTNLSLEHTEFHPDMEDYYQSKKRLFTQIKPLNKTCIITIDDHYGRRMVQECIEEKVENLKTVSINNPEANYHASNIDMSSKGSTFKINYSENSFDCEIKLAGKFNVFNALMAAAIALESGISPAIVQSGLKSIECVPGRLENVKNDRGINIIVDYAHSPDALENVLSTLSKITEKRLITVFGCGGNRSSDKRPLMGKIAWDNSDVVIVTSDNPRKELPDEIINQIIRGIDKNNNINKILFDDPDRKSAIKKALELAQRGDTIVVAGKGHETGQELSDKTIPFDDKQVIKDLLRKIDNGS